MYDISECCLCQRSWVTINSHFCNTVCTYICFCGIATARAHGLWWSAGQDANRQKKCPGESLGGNIQWRWGNLSAGEMFVAKLSKWGHVRATTRRKVSGRKCWGDRNVLGKFQNPHTGLQVSMYISYDLWHPG